MDTLLRVNEKLYFYPELSSFVCVWVLGTQDELEQECTLFVFKNTRTHAQLYMWLQRNVLSYSLESSQIVSYVEGNGSLFKD